MKSGRKPAQRARKKASRTKRIGQVRRHEVADQEWEFLDPLIPRSSAKTGRNCSLCLRPLCGGACRCIRDWLRDHGITPVIPHKDNEHARTDGRVKFEKDTYRRRSIIENVIGWLKECRRIGTRYEKLAISFQAVLQLAMIRTCFKIAFSDRA